MQETCTQLTLEHVCIVHNRFVLLQGMVGTYCIISIFRVAHKAYAGLLPHGKTLQSYFSGIRHAAVGLMLHCKLLV